MPTYPPDEEDEGLALEAILNRGVTRTGRLPKGFSVLEKGFKNITNDFRRDEYGVLMQRSGYAIEKRDNGAGVSGWLVTNKSLGKMWSGSNLTFRSAVSIFKALISGRRLPASVEEWRYSSP